MSSSTRRRFPVSAFTDEQIEQGNLPDKFHHLRSPRQQAYHSVRWGMNRIALRFIAFDPDNPEGINIAKIDDGQREQLRLGLLDSNVKVSSIGSPIGKAHRTFADGVNDVVSFDEVVPFARRVFETAQILNAPYVRIFAPKVETPELAIRAYPQALSEIRALVAIGREYDRRIALENEIATAAPDIATAYKLVAEIDDPFLGLAVDGGNEIGSGNLSEAGLRSAGSLAALKTFTVHGKCVALTDPQLQPGRWTPEKLLTRFCSVQGPFFDALFGTLPTRIDELAALGLDIPLELEPHMALSERSFGLTYTYQYNQVLRETRRYLEAAGFDPCLEATRFWTGAES